MTQKLSLLLLLALVIPTVGSAEPVDIQALIDAAGDESTVTVPAGDHLTAVPILITARKGLTIVFEKGAKVICTNVYEHVVVLKGSTNVTVRGGHFTHRSPSEKDMCEGSVIVVENSRHIILEACDINGTGLVGVWAGNSSELTVRECFIHDNTREAIYVRQCSDVLMTKNRIASWWRSRPPRFLKDHSRLRT